MKQTIIPQCCLPSKNKKTGEEIPALYSGRVVMRMPDYDQRMDLIDSSSVQIDEGEDEELARIRISKESGSRMIRNVVKKLPEFIESFEIKRIEDGFEFTDIGSEAVQYDSEMCNVLNELAGRLIGKFDAGKVVPGS